MGRYRPMRQGNGRFRSATLGDFGMASCDRCGTIWTPDMTGLEGPFVDPRDVAKRRRECPKCDGAKSVGHVFETDQ